jgi:transposase
MPFLGVRAYDEFQRKTRLNTTRFLRSQPSKTITHLESTMSTITTPAGRASAANLSNDFVSTDTAALASHMSRCASTRSRFFSVHAVAESLKSLLFARMVTALLIAAVLAGATALV